MNTREYKELFQYLNDRACRAPHEVVFVESIAKWCRQHGLDEKDEQRPFMAMSSDGHCGMLVREDIPEKTLDDRINAARMRDQILRVANEQVDMLDSARKKLAFLFLREYAASLPDIEHDRLADAWAFEQMKRLGLFSE